MSGGYRLSSRLTSHISLRRVAESPHHRRVSRDRSFESGEAQEVRTAKHAADHDTRETPCSCL